MERGAWGCWATPHSLALSLSLALGSRSVHRGGLVSFPLKLTSDAQPHPSFPSHRKTFSTINQEGRTGCFSQWSLNTGRIFLWTTTSCRSSRDGCWPISSSKGSMYSSTGPKVHMENWVSTEMSSAEPCLPHAWVSCGSRATSTHCSKAWSSQVIADKCDLHSSCTTDFAVPAACLATHFPPSSYESKPSAGPPDPTALLEEACRVVRDLFQ